MVINVGEDSKSELASRHLKEVKMDPSALYKVLSDSEELSPHKEFLKRLAISSVDIKITLDEPADAESRFSGIPMVPDGFSWPVHPDGEYRFLGQINFSEILNRPAELPSFGLLSLFYAYNQEQSIFWGDDGYIIGYYWPRIEKLSLSLHIANVSPARKIVLVGGVEIPRDEIIMGASPLGKYALDDLCDVVNECRDYMLGYPSSCTLCYDPTPEGDWISLLTLSSYDEFDWCWHDGDRLMVFIERERLAMQDFSYLKADAG